jgi:hypothetical protein
MSQHKQISRNYASPQLDEGPNFDSKLCVSLRMQVEALSVKL